MRCVSGWLKEEIASFCDLFFFSFLSLLFSFDRCYFDIVDPSFICTRVVNANLPRERFETRADGK